MAETRFTPPEAETWKMPEGKGRNQEEDDATRPQELRQYMNDLTTRQLILADSEDVEKIANQKWSDEEVKNTAVITEIDPTYSEFVVNFINKDGELMYIKIDLKSVAGSQDEENKGDPAGFLKKEFDKIGYDTSERAQAIVRGIKQEVENTKKRETT